jgi:hypothetical protein
MTLNGLNYDFFGQEFGKITQEFSEKDFEFFSRAVKYCGEIVCGGMLIYQIIVYEMNKYLSLV